MPFIPSFPLSRCNLVGLFNRNCLLFQSDRAIGQKSLVRETVIILRPIAQINVLTAKATSFRFERQKLAMSEVYLFEKTLYSSMFTTVPIERSEFVLLSAAAAQSGRDSSIIGRVAL